MRHPRPASRVVGLTVVVVAASCVLAAAGGAPASAATGADASSTLDPGLRHQLAAAGPQSLVDAVVVLKSQTDLTGIKAGNRAQRVSGTVTALRNHAAQSQRPILALLSQRRAQGLVDKVQPLWVANDVVVRATPAVIQELAARPEVREIRPDATIQAPPAQTALAVQAAAVEPNVALVNAPAMWEAGFRGQGVVVANMDTGVDATHPDLASKWRGGTNSWYDPNGQHPTTPTDISGHGTQTMGVMVGGDAGGTSVGVAPDAKWIAVKIFADNGSAATSAIHLGFQWLLDPDGDPSTADAPNVVNASWTMTSPGCTLDFQPDLQSLRSAGILPVFAAGNYGPTAGTVFSPANLPEAFAVGGTDNSDAIDPFSSRGASACAGAVAPELVAPDTGIQTTDAFGGYVADTGTSVAAPHVAGSLALLLSANVGLTADQQEAALETGAVDLGPAGVDNDFGYGRLDVLAAYRSLSPTPDFAVSVSPSSASAPPGGTATYTVTVTGGPGFSSDVALDLTGLSAAQAGWTFTPAAVPGGSGTSTLSVQTAATTTPGSYPLTITGTSGATVHSASATLDVPAPDFALAAAPSVQTAGPGSSSAFTVTTTAANGFAGLVALSLTGLPPTVGSATFTPPTVTGAGSAQLTVSTLPTAPAGTYPLTITGTSGSVTHSVPVTLVVTARGFTLSAAPATVTIRRGRAASYQVSVAAVGGFTGWVALSAAGLPAGSSAHFSVNGVRPPGASTLRVRTTAVTPRGTYTLRITGKNGSVVHQVTVTLIVR